MAIFRQQFARAIVTAGCALLVLPAAQTQSLTGLPRRGLAENSQPASKTPPPASPSATPAQAAVSPAPQPAPAALSLLQQPAQEAKILFAADNLSIHADNSSLIAILRQFAASSGMRLDGLNGDERVFGSFGPGAPRDVLADLLNGTAYNVLMLGDLSNGAPRELILSPSTTGVAAPVTPAPAASNAEEPSGDQESSEVPPPPQDMPPPPANNPPPTPGVKTPQQLFEQLQRMRQSQQQQQQEQTQQPQQ